MAFVPSPHPIPTVDVIIEMPRGGIVLIRRANPPFGWALPGGFVDEGESCEQAAVREALEETSLHVVLLRQLGAYSKPSRDPRLHTLSVVFAARPLSDDDLPRAATDADAVQVFARDEIPWSALAFDHAEILRHYLDGTGPSVSLTGESAYEDLSAHHAASLLAHAREALHTFIHHGLMLEKRLESARLRVRQGVFVSFFEGKRLRTSVGRAVMDLPLDMAVVELTLLAAALESRLVPLTEQSADGLQVVIDVVTELRPVSGPVDVQLGVDGVVVERHGRRAALLPRVARQHGWNVERFVEAACERAGLDRADWLQSDALLQVFRTQELVEQRS
jgi:ADP-ribose pyrophosphatase YjhB (NUDIX family)/AMMECR1 domain-containing protein